MIPIEFIAEQGAKDFKALVMEAKDPIEKAISETIVEAELNETRPKFPVSFKINVDPTARRMESVLSYGMKYRLSKETEIPDPNQEKLPLEEEEPTVRIRTIDPDTGEDHDTGNIPISKFKKAAAKLKGN